MAKTKAAGPATKGLRITTKRDGFRRAGIEFTGTQVLPLSDLTTDQVEAIKAEPMLIVDEVDVEAEKA
jgi:hypothetical protein